MLTSQNRGPYAAARFQPFGCYAGARFRHIGNYARRLSQAYRLGVVARRRSRAPAGVVLRGAQVAVGLEGNGHGSSSSAHIVHSVEHGDGFLLQIQFLFHGFRFKGYRYLRLSVTGRTLRPASLPRKA